jgi:RNA polymerase sigma-70 factor, ECF subfamily
MDLEVNEPLESLIKKAQNGDRESFDLLFEQHREGLMSLLRRRTGPRLRALVEVEDLYQDTCLKAYEAIRDFQFRGGNSLLPWLGRIAENVIRNAARHHFKTHKRYHQEVSLDLPCTGAASSAPVRHLAAEGCSPSQAMSREERLKRLENAFRGLSKDHREAIFLARLRGLPIKEIAVRMGRSPDAVSMLILRALRELKQRFGHTDSLSLPSRGLDASTTCLVHFGGAAGAASPGASEVSPAKSPGIADFIGKLFRSRMPSTGLRASEAPQPSG